MEFIRRNACGDIATQDVAAEMGLSRRMAEILFRKQTGHTIHDEVLSVRMERVERLLIDCSMQISAWS